jgi:outer membrane lipoprotein-sorting protein
MKFSRLLIPAVFALLLSAPGCLFHTRTVEIRLSNAKLQTATQQQLVDRLNQEAGRIKTLNATVDIDSSVGGEKRGKITDFKEIRGYVLVRKPNMMRMIGLYPIVRNKAFDMVSDGHEFKVSIPATNKFYIGHNQAIKDSANPLDTIRPQSIYDALLLQEIDPQNEVAVLESSNEMVFDAQTRKMVQQPNYVLDVIRRTDKGWILARKVVFDRTNLSPHRQITFDDSGNRVTEASYQLFKQYDGIPYPSLIDIKRPQEEYDIRLIMVKLTLNQPITEDQFALQQPVGSELVNLDERNKNAGAKQDAPSATSAQTTSTTDTSTPH